MRFVVLAVLLLAAAAVVLAAPSVGGEGSEAAGVKGGPRRPPRCEPGARWIHADGCNRCACSPAGLPACTRMFCRPPVPQPQPQPYPEPQPEPQPQPYPEPQPQPQPQPYPEPQPQPQPQPYPEPQPRPYPEPQPQPQPQPYPVPQPQPQPQPYPAPQQPQPQPYPAPQQPQPQPYPEPQPEPETLDLGEPTALPPPAKDADGGRCVAGSTWKSDDGCNTCFCKPGGVPGCTLRACGMIVGLPREPQEPQEPRGPLDVEESKESEVSKEVVPQRNAGRKTAPYVKRPSGYRPGGSWPAPAYRPPVFGTSDPSVPCEPGTTVKRDCNTCRCGADGKNWACTRRICPEGHREKRQQQQCTPGEHFKSADGCNDCTCTETGVAICTLRACLFPPN